MNYAECPNCEAKVNVGAVLKIGHPVVCKSCDTKLEISWLDPLELDWPTDSSEYVYEDEDDDYDYEDD